MTQGARLRWSLDGFARRAMMGSRQMYLVVEGRRFDRTFYDRILSAATYLGTNGHEIILSEEIASNAAGGKQSIFTIFDYLQRRNNLFFRGKSFDRYIAFAVDKDFDDVLATAKRTDHIIYTAAADVEADIHINGELARSLSSCLSITTEDATALASSLNGYAKDLADVWREWITLCVLALAFRSRCSVRPSSHSTINDLHYESLNEKKQNAAESEMRACAGTAITQSKEIWLRRRVNGMYRQNRQHLLVKGKLLPKYLLWRLKALTAGRVVDLNGFEAMITHLQLEAVDFRQPWADHYHGQFRALISRQEDPS